MQSEDGLETGGILLGRGPDTNSRLYVEQAGDAGPNAKREEGYFQRDTGHATTLSRQAWEDHRRVWVGDWHTHPHGDPAPSSLDVTTYARHLSDSELGFEVFVSIIVVPGGERNWTAAKLVTYLFASDATVTIDEALGP